ncbi:hypothetical protein CRE_11002 [Caenorhabditis remanei]|uniref:Uncharacterized protein n=1 Tax=Caenorhabditis remanei TaxID=31234 RepID=E3M5X8_CAERE|nr:hypothetical protein CRE_11002 [Caenorhabditis remanei]
MFHQFFFIFLIFSSIIGASIARDSEENDDRIVVKAERPLALRTRRPIKYVPFGRHRETWYK